MYQEVIQMVTTTTVLNLTLLIYTGEEVAGREDLWVHHQPGRGGGEIQEPAET